jgi:hypothetical protein
VAVKPAVISCLQVQSVETIRIPADVQSQTGGEQVSMFGDTALATVNPLRERLFLAVPAEAVLGQGGRVGGVFVQPIAAGAFSLAADRLHEHPWGPVPH